MFTFELNVFERGGGILATAKKTYGKATCVETLECVDFARGWFKVIGRVLSGQTVFKYRQQILPIGTVVNLGYRTDNSSTMFEGLGL